MRVDEAFNQEEERVSRPSKRARLEACEYGNYAGYYNKRKHTAGDPRLALVPLDWTKGKRVLDVGCNAGKVTIEIAQKRAPYRVVGVDIDSELIRSANKQVRIEWSQCGPIPALQAAADALDRRKASKNGENGHVVDSSFVSEPGYFPASLSRMFGFLPYAPSELMSSYEELDEAEQKARTRPGGRGKAMPREIRHFPENIKFKTTDWLNEDIEDDRRGYDLILAFSVSKWIHINEGDKGIKDFFAKVFESLRPEGRFVIEPQMWDSYVKARRKSQVLADMCDGLELRPESFTKILLEEIGFVKVEELGTVGEQGFARPVLAFSKAGGSYI